MIHAGGGWISLDVMDTTEMCVVELQSTKNDGLPAWHACCEITQAARRRVHSGSERDQHGRGVSELDASERGVS